MKKIVIAFVSTLTIFAGSVSVASTASATPSQDNTVWTFVKSVAPEGASIIGKSETVKGAKLVCRIFRAGGTVDDVMDPIIENAMDMDSYTQEVFLDYSVAMVVGGVAVYCPRYTKAVDRWSNS